MMLDVVKKKLNDLAGKWRGEVKVAEGRMGQPNEYTATLSSCATDLDVALTEIEAETERLTPEQFAVIHGVTEQTVTGWCRRGHLKGAEKGANGWRIPRDAKPPQLRSA